MPAIAAFLKGTVSESLTKLVQPAGLVPATFFVLLNLAFIYPVALADGVGVAKTFSGLDAAWQTVVAVALVFALGYFLLNSANATTEALSGENWRGSILGSILTGSQRIRRWRLEHRRDKAEGNENETELSWRLATHFPPSSTGTLYLAPTRLGNVLAATQHTLDQRYGIDLTALWGPLESSESVKDSPALASVKEEKSTLDLLANTIFILALFTLEGLAFFGLRQRWREALLSLLALPIAFIAYRVAVRTARTWGDSVIVAFDLHRDELRKSLGLREPAGIVDERELWRKATGFYLPGADDVDPAEVFDASRPTMTVTQPAGLTVTTVASEISDIGGGPRTGRKHIVLRTVDYVFLVARAGQAWRFGDADIIVSDPRVVAIDGADLPSKVSHGPASATARLQTTAAAARLIWQITRLDEGGSLTLDYKLPIWTLAAEPEVNLPLEAVVDGVNGFRLNFATTVTDVTLIVTAMTTIDPLSPPRLCLGSERKNLDPSGGDPRIYRSERLSLGAPRPDLWLVLP
jgi:hypothetical protein